MRFLFGLLSVGLLAGCVHHHPIQGEQARAEIPEGVRARIGSKEVREGDRVHILQPVCQKVNRGRHGVVETCRDQKVGGASVLKVLDHDLAIIQTDAGVAWTSTMKVEKE